MTSNVGFRSTVVPGSVGELVTDERLRHKVRGVKAIRKLAEVLRVTASTLHFSAHQMSELTQETPCSRCGIRPEGPVLVNGQVVLALRCPQGACPAAGSRVREVRLDDTARRRLLARSSEADLGAAIDDLLQSKFDLTARRPLDGPVVPCIVRLSPSTYYMVSGLSVHELSGVVAGLLDRHE